MKKTKKNFEKLYKPVCNILWLEWDPIGVNDSPNARNEYDSYATKICHYLIEGADEKKIANHLAKLENGSMDLQKVNEENNYRVAKLLKELVEK